MTIIIGLKLENRVEASIRFQEILTEYGCKIKTRIGLHVTSEDKCDNFGVILLEITDKNILSNFTSKLNNIGISDVQTMKF